MESESGDVSLSAEGWPVALAHDIEEFVQFADEVPHDLLSELRALQVDTIAGGISPLGEIQLGLIMRRLSKLDSELVAWTSDVPRLWAHLQRVGDLLNRVEVDADGWRSAMELWQTRPLRFPAFTYGPGRSGVMALWRKAEAENHLPGVKWHIHLLDQKSAKHLGYRLLFDARRTQTELAWEAHGDASRQPLGDPARVALSQARSSAIHEAALRACAAKSALTGGRAGFKTWAARFEPTSAKSCVCHPAVREPTKW